MAGPSLTGLLNPDMLTWAREQSRMDIESAAKRMGQTPQRLHEWETNQRAPTLKQLRKLATLYKRSVGIFFLKKRPSQAKQPVDYRRIELSDINSMSPALANGIREAQAKRESALDIFIELEDQPPQWNLLLPNNIPAEQAAARMLDRLGITMEMRAQWGSHYEALNGWRSAVESLGVLVIQISSVSMREMRGCCLAIYPLPVIILNSSDSPLGRVFTLLHELTHLVRQESSLCDLIEDAPRLSAAEAIEVYCNHVAGAMLVPLPTLLSMPGVENASANSVWSPEQLGNMRRIFWASREVILRRLLIHNKTSLGFYRQMRLQFQAEYAEQTAKVVGPIIVPYYKKVILSNGRLLTRLAVNAYNVRAITGSELSRILNSKLDHLPKIREALVNEVVA